MKGVQHKQGWLQICSEEGADRQIDILTPPPPNMDAEIRQQIEETARERENMGVLESEADFFTGAMTMYLALKPESEEDGAWCPPAWLFTLMRGDSIIEMKNADDIGDCEGEAKAEAEAERAADARAELEAEQCYDDRYDDYY